jgi:hypothetical protein
MISPSPRYVLGKGGLKDPPTDKREVLEGIGD